MVFFKYGAIMETSPNDTENSVLNSEETAAESDANASSDDLVAAFKAQAKKRKKIAHSQSSDANSELELQLKIYLADAEAESATKLKAINYWYSKKDLLPSLYKISCALLAVPATSAPCERVFSKASIVLDKNRHNLSVASFENELFLKFNSEMLI